MIKDTDIPNKFKSFKVPTEDIVSEPRGKKALDYCAHCGMSSEDHCAFEPVMVDARCVCEWESWGSNDIPPVCNRFNEEVDGTCVNCCHSYECHD